MTPTLAALPRIILPRLWSNHHLRRYRRQICGVWEISLYARCLPGLARLPLPLRPAGSERSGFSLAEALEQQCRLRIINVAGTGRSLALRQVLLLWAQGLLDLGERVPLLISLPGASPEPNEALAATLAGAGFDYSPTAVGRSLTAGEFVLLLDGWDELPAPLQQQWRQWLSSIARRFPKIPICLVTGPSDSLEWEQFEPWEMLPPDPPLLAAWLRHLLPEIDPELLLAPLVVDERLRTLGRRLIEVALLAWTYPHFGFSSNRSQLYLRALIYLLQREYEGDVRKLRARLAALGFSALQMRVPPQAPQDLHLLFRKLNGFTDLGADGRLHFAHSAWLIFLAALHLAESNPLPDLKCSDPAWREAIALAAGLLDDPSPLYRACLNGRSTPAQVTLALGGALREHRQPLRGWSELILGNLARLSAMSRPEAAEAHVILADLPDMLAETVARSLDGQTKTVRWALDTLRWLPAHLAAPHLIPIVADATRESAQRREAAQILLNYPEATILVPIGPLAHSRLDPLGRLLCTALLSLGGPAGRQFLAMLFGRGTDLFPQAVAEEDRVLQARAALALIEDQAVEPACREHATVALAASLDERTIDVILKACISPVATVRAAARQALLAVDGQLALRSFARLALGQDIPWVARTEALCDLAQLQGSGVDKILARMLRCDGPSVAAAMLSADLLVGRGEPGLRRLLEALSDQAVPLSIRARIAALFGEMGWRPALNTLLTLACRVSPSPLRAAAARALGGFQCLEAVAVLCGLISDERDDLETLLASIFALGELGAEDSIYALRGLLMEPLEERLLARWRAALPPGAEVDQPSSWEIGALPEPFQWRLLAALAAGDTPADSPSCLRELVATEARQVRSVAVAAVTQIGGSIARQMLGEVLRALPPLGNAHLLSVCLGSLGGASELAGVAESSAHPLIRLAAIQALAQLPEGIALVKRYIGGAESDPFICGMLIESLVASGHDGVAAALEAIACNEALTPGLRAQAIRGLGTIGHHASLELLLAFSARTEAPAEIRAAAIGAAAALRAPDLFPLLVDLLAGQHLDPLIAVEALRALGQSGIREALPILLQYAQSSDQELAIAALDALGEQHDPTVAPVLVKLSQMVHAPPEVRVRALGVLVKLGGEEYVPLLRYYLENGSLPIRLAALDFLLAAPGLQPLDLDQAFAGGWPLPMCLRLLNWFAAQPASALQPLVALLANANAAIQLRCLAAEALGRAGYTPALPALIDLARLSTTPPQLRRRAVESLTAFAEPEALLALGELASSDAPAVRTWAVSGLSGQR